jgi:PAS domain-containing protein
MRAVEQRHGTTALGDDPTAAALFAAPGEMAARCRAFDWASTPLGAVETWSRSLRTMADAVLASRNPMLLFWGPELVQLYNDAFRPSLGASTGPGARHPRALGMPASAFWTDVWDVVGPQLDGVMTRGEAVWFENMHLPIERDGRMDDAWWTYSYSPVRGDDGGIAGTLVVCLETTATVRAYRDLELERARSAGILESMADAQYAVDHFRIVGANRAMERNVGLTRGEMIGRSAWEIFPGLLGTPWERAYRTVAEQGIEQHLTGH